METRSLKSSDVDCLLRLAEAEDWLCDRREFEIYRRLNLAMGLVTILLTSAPRAEPLYRRLGFKPLHNIYRWQRPAVPSGFSAKLIGDRYNLRRVIELDSACWILLPTCFYLKP